MLTKFEVSNFKNFSETISLDLTKVNNYEFNPECVVDGTVRKALIYAHNGMGKSNLGFAIFDLISHLTDKNSGSQSYGFYTNASSNDPIAKFQYEFLFDSGKVVYEYGKTGLESLVHEKITINNELYASLDRSEGSVASISALGAENLKRDIGESQISIVSYIRKNSILEENSNNNCFSEFVEFVNSMLFFRSLNENNYIGYEQGSTEVGVDIVEHDNVKEFESLLHEAGIECRLGVLEGGENPILAFDFNGKLIPFYEIASQGTKALLLFYYWYQRFSAASEVSFLFIDEFDAFYHHSLSVLIVKMLKKVDAQVVLTTHNTSIMTNELLRPDCYFLLNEKGIHSLAKSTAKDLREAHNIEKMYRAGSFSG